MRQGVQQVDSQVRMGLARLASHGVVAAMVWVALTFVSSPGGSREGDLHVFSGVVYAAEMPEVLVVSPPDGCRPVVARRDRKSTRLNSSH